MPQIISNKKALHDYEVLEKYEAGIVLEGQEVKSVKSGHLNLRGSYVSYRDNGLYLIGCHITPYRMAAPRASYQPTRDRRLILRRREIASLAGKLTTRGLTLLPISVYTKGGLIKFEIGVCRGKKLYDKRASIKKRELDRSIRRAVGH